jgi:hypothetical protein
VPEPTACALAVIAVATLYWHGMMRQSRRC